MIEIMQVSVAEGIRYAVFGKRFPSREAAENYRGQTIAKRNKLAGRELSDRELLSGPVKVDDRRGAQKAADENWRVVTGDEEEIDDNPFRKKPTMPKDAREGLRRQQEAAWDAKKSDAERRAAMGADPVRQRMVQFAEEHLERVTYSDAPYSAVVSATQLLAQARQGDLEHCRAMADTVVARETERYAERRAAAEQRLAAEQKLLSEMQPPPSPAGEAPPAEPRRYVFRDGKTIPADQL